MKLPTSWLVFVLFLCWFLWLLSPIIAADEAPQTDCKLPGLVAGGNGSVITYLMAQRGAQRAGGTVYVPPDKVISCKTLNLSGEVYRRGRWLAVMRSNDWAPRTWENSTFYRYRPNGIACSMDINGDGIINSYELGQLRIQFTWKCNLYLCSADFSGDGVVNFRDASLLAANWLERCAIR